MPAAGASPSFELEKPAIPPERTRSELLGSNVSIKGQVVSHEDLYLDGEVEGAIEAPGSTVTVGPQARIIATINARKVIIVGSVHGSVTALDSIELRQSCKLVGDVKTSQIVIEDGAYLKGSIDIRPMNQPSLPDEDKLGALSSKLAPSDASLHEPIMERHAHGSGA